MLNGLPILIVEDDPLIALNLATAIEDLDGRPIWPVVTVEAALKILETETIEAAILDANLLDRDITPVAIALTEKAVPFVIHSGTGIPEELAAKYPHLPLVMKPAAITAVLATLLQCVSPDRTKFEI
jgi:DNA-binding NtrC family response regulator